VFFLSKKKCLDYVILFSPLDAAYVILYLNNMILEIVIVEEFLQNI
jgi:hypothetical protein